MSAGYLVAVVLGVTTAGAFVAYAAQAAMSRDWRAAGAYVVVLVSVLAVAVVALWFN